ncbi:hypothetical protein [Stenotrophomonas sp.]|uniref:hypothetical protein n=1 Tax=Stenotrophomonas sp. TaxID=69392 RepID=UPI002FC80D11
MAPSAAAWLLLCLGLAGSAQADTVLNAQAKALADGWIGRDASALLLQLRVDGGRVQIDEDDATLETRYTWTTIQPAWTEKVYVSGGEFLYNEPTPPSGYRPVFAPIHYRNVEHPPVHRCDISYIADREGRVQRWVANGIQCDEDVVGPQQRR